MNPKVDYKRVTKLTNFSQTEQEKKRNHRFLNSVTEERGIAPHLQKMIVLYKNTVYIFMATNQITLMKWIHFQKDRIAKNDPR